MWRLAVRAGLVSALALSVSAGARAEQPWPGHRDASGYTYYKEKRTTTPEHGYSGFAGHPLRQSYCDYRPIPERNCSGGRCRVTGWTLQQYCY